MAAADQFLSDHNGQALDFDGQYGAQCVDAVAFYVRDYLHAPVFYADAARWYNDFDTSPLVGSFTKIANSSTALPINGDIIIWDASLANSGGAGHIAIVLAANYNNFVSIDQNWAGKYVHQVTHNWDKVIGWLRPNANLTTPGMGAQETNEVIDSNDTGILRIVHSEVGNWDSAKVHAGEFDKLFMDTYNGQSVKDFIWGQWNNGQPHRVNQYIIDQLNATIANLTATSSTNQAKAQQDAATLQKQLAEAQANLTVAQAKIKQPSDDTKLLDDTGNALTRLLARLFGKK